MSFTRVLYKIEANIQQIQLDNIDSSCCEMYQDLNELRKLIRSEIIERKRGEDLLKLVLDMCAQVALTVLVGLAMVGLLAVWKIKDLWW
tara:strand:+ start:4310 stop:4576 length:267 start_codon:yes stop_codon:yes gene_type:complete